MQKTLSKQLGLSVANPELPAPKLDYQLGLAKESTKSNFMGFDGSSYSLPSDATNTGKAPFNKYIKDRKDEVITLAQRNQNDRANPLYWDKRVLDADIDEASISALVDKAEEVSKQQLSTANKLRNEAIKIEDDWNTTAKTARERVDAQINAKARDKKLDDGAWSKIGGIRTALMNHASAKVLRDAYKIELETRLDNRKAINDALAGNDIAKLEKVLSIATSEAEKTAIQSKIQILKEEEARQNQIGKLQDSLSSATNENQINAIQQEIAKLEQESASLFGGEVISKKPNWLLIGGIGLVVVLGLVFVRNRASN